MISPLRVSNGTTCKGYGPERYYDDDWSAICPEWMWYNPLETDTLTKYVISQLRPAINAKPAQQEIMIPPKNISPAEKLPVEELLEQIIISQDTQHDHYNQPAKSYLP